MPRYFKLMLLLFLCLLLSVLLIVGPTITKGDLDPTVFAKVFSGANSYIDDFAPGSPNGSVVLAAQSLPNTVQSDSVAISPDGQWLFAVATPNSSNYKPVMVSRIVHPFANPLSFPSWTSLSSDSQVLFYLSVDDTGRFETFNFLRLSSGAVIELLAVPLTSPVNPTRPPFRLPQYDLPIPGWTLNNSHVTFFSCRTEPCSQTDIVDFFSVDLSGIDMTRSGYWNLPQRTTVRRASKLTDFGSASPDGNKIAYLYTQDAQSGSTPKLAIQDVTTGHVTTVETTTGTQVSNLLWDAGSTDLFYLEHQGDRVQIYQYDVDSQKSDPVFTSLNTASLRSAQICGDNLFYVQSEARQETLYDAGLTDDDPGQAVFTADRIQLLTCGTPYSWQPDKVGACNPFCTPTPAVPVGTSADVQSLDLSGGDIANGQQLYDNVLGCSACHNTAAVGPRTQGIYTRVVNVRLKDPLNVEMTPEQYLAESILHPDAYIAPGFPAGVMPQNYGDQITLSDLRDLVAYLTTQR